MDYILSRSTSEGQLTHINQDKTINHLAYADDIALIDSSTSQANKHIKLLEKEALRVGLSINWEKTKYMTNIINEKERKKVKKIERVDDFKYLGSNICLSKEDILQRRKKAFAIFWSMKKIWSSADINTNLKVRLFHATCVPLLLYGCEAWIITKQMEKLINSFGTSCYRYILQRAKIERITNEEILNEVGRSELILEVRRRQLNNLGKLLRSNHPLKEYALYYPEIGKRKRGKPAETFNKYIEKITGKSIEELKQIVNNKERWLVEIIDGIG